MGRYSYLFFDIMYTEKIKKRRSVPKKKHAIQAPDQPNEENVRLPLVEQQAIELRGCEEQLRRSLAKEALNTTERKNITIRDEVSAPPNPRMVLYYEIIYFKDQRVFIFWS